MRDEVGVGTLDARTPNFLVIGAARSGTTALYSYLRQHPDVFMPSAKEPNFFAFEGETLDCRGPGADWINNSTTCGEAYLRLFDGSQGYAARGEASPLYLYAPKAPERIRAWTPDARLVAILRDPAEQAYSHYLYARQNMIESIDNFEEALEAEEERLAQGWQPLFGYSSFPRYGEQLARFYGLFDPGQIKVFLYEDFEAHPMRVIGEVFEFIGVDPAFTPDMTYRPNISGVPKHKLAQGALMEPHLLTRIVGSLLPPQARRWVKDRVSRMNTERPEMSARARAVLRRRQREDTLRLQALLGRDLSAWLDAAPA